MLFCSNLTKCVKYQQFQCKITITITIHVGVCKYCSTKMFKKTRCFFLLENLHSWHKFYMDLNSAQTVHISEPNFNTHIDAHKGCILMHIAHTDRWA